MASTSEVNIQVTVFQHPGVTLVLYDSLFKGDELSVLLSLKTRKDELLRALAGRREAVVAASRLLEEHPRISGVTIDLRDEDLESLSRLEGKMGKGLEDIYLSVAREKVPIKEDPENIEIAILVYGRSYPEKDKQLGQAIFILPPPFVCQTWDGETVLPA
ncbi:hypothetical protein E6H19_10530 [Candidatus Bathyarchaeota archaeon]|nr:MAG: hypothetical protein E6H19_10530 [Candidatus Bathyarchaeota archaeon]